MVSAGEGLHLRGNSLTPSVWWLFSYESSRVVDCRVFNGRPLRSVINFECMPLKMIVKT